MEKPCVGDYVSMKFLSARGWIDSFNDNTRMAWVELETDTPEQYVSIPYGELMLIVMSKKGVL